MKKFATTLTLALGLTLGSLGAASSYVAFKNVAHVTSSISVAVNDTWASLSERGYSGAVEAANGSSVIYTFERGLERLEVTFRQTETGVTIVTKDAAPELLALSR